MGHNVGGADQVYIVAALVLEREHHTGQFFLGYRASLAELAYGVVLAKGAVQIAVGEEDSP